MTNIILCGCNGHMGKTITDVVNTRDDINIVAGVDIRNDLSADYPVYSKISLVKEKADAVIDFSHPSLLDDILSYCKNTNTPAVICTTGNSDENILKIHKASAVCPVFFSYNMSLGINLMTELIVKAQSVLGDQFDIEIIEKHHNKKIDAPSGTALMLADALKANGEYESVFERKSVRKPRSKNEIGITSVRGGTIVGEHTVLFAGTDETIEIKHTAFSKKVFAVGAVNAAIWLSEQKPGIYSMKDMI